MKIIKDSNINGYTIRSYAPGNITISCTHVDDTSDAPKLYKETLTKSIIITPRRLFRWPPQNFAELKFTHLELFPALEVEVVVLGTGIRQQFVDLEWISWCNERGIGLEVMTTSAACRTYNILLADDRKVAAALINQNNY